jgi:hypothetical protein
MTNLKSADNNVNTIWRVAFQPEQVNRRYPIIHRSKKKTQRQRTCLPVRVHNKFVFARKQKT